MESYATPATTRLDLRSATRLLEEHKKSGLSFKAFCQTKNVPTSRLNYWRHRLGKKASEGIKFVALPSAVPAPSTPSTMHVEFTLPSGISMRVPADIDKACLVSLLRAAREAA